MLWDHVTEIKSKLIVAVGGSLVALGVSGVQLYRESFGTNTVVVATSPAEATIRINGKELGRAPLTAELKRGTYTIEATRPGFEPAQHAVFVSAREPNLVNIQLLPVVTRQQASATADSSQSNPTSDATARLEAEVGKLKAALIANPDEALSLPLLREKVRVQEELTKAIREDLKDVKDQGKWYLGSMIAIVVGLLAVIATLFVGQRAK